MTVKIDLLDGRALYLQPDAEIVAAVGRLAMVAALVEGELNYRIARRHARKSSGGMSVTAGRPNHFERTRPILFCRPGSE